MTSRIKGITVEIGGDTTKLQNALRSVDRELKSTQAQLRDVNKMLKLDPGNTELMAQKHRLLGDAVRETKERLETLKTAAQQANEALAKGEISKDQYDALQREIVETENELKNLTTEADRAGTALQSMAAKGEKLKTIGDGISGVGMKLLPVTAAVTGLGVAAVKTAADFDTSMSKVAAVSGATGQELDSLRDKAREMGSKTKFSAAEAADAMNYMAMAGWKTQDMLSGIEGIMNLAAASGEELATTSDIVTDALTAFGLSAADSGHFADVLAAASSNANTNVSMMGETFKYAAPIAGALGFSVEDTAEAIGLMGNAGIKASQAGTALRTIMNNLAGDVTLTGAAFGEMNIETTNTDGSMRSLSEILANCREAFSQMSESEKAANAEALVGKNAMSGFLAIMNAAPADIEKLSGAINNCQGSAASMAGIMQDNLAGQLTILKSQLQELAISFGELLMPTIRDVVSWIQKVVDWLNSLDEGTKNTIIKIAAVVAAVGPVLIVVGKIISSIGTIMTIVPKVVSAIKGVQTAFSLLNAVMMANPIMLIISLIAMLIAAFVGLWNTNEDFRNFWIDLWGDIKEGAEKAWNGIKDFFATAWDSIKTTAQTTWGAVSEYCTTTWQKQREGAEQIWSQIKNTVTTKWEETKQNAETVWGAISNFFTTTWQENVQNGQTAWSELSEFFSSTWETISTRGQEIWNGLDDFFTNLWTKIENVFTTTFQNIRNAVETYFQNYKDTAITTWETIRDSVSNALDMVKQRVTEAFQNVRNTIHTVMDDARNALTNAWHNIVDGVRNAMTNVFNAVKNGFQNAKNHLTGLAKQSPSWGRDIINGIVNGIKSSMSRVADACRSVARTIRSYLHFSVPDVGPLTDYESWMPDFMKGLAKGIEKSKGLVADAMDSVAAGMNLSPVLQTSAPAMAESITKDNNSGLLSQISDMISNFTGEKGDITIPVYIGQDRIDEIVVTASQRAQYRSGGR